MRSRPNRSAYLVRNRLLGALPADRFERLRPHLEPVALRLQELLIASGEVIAHAYFIEDGMVSMVQPLSDGAAIEIGVIGREGFIGSPVMLGARTSACDAKVLLKGSAFKISTKPLLEAVEDDEQFKSLLLCFTHAFHIQVGQTAACNGRHNVRQRLARWLLSASERSDGDELALSHEVLSANLGLRRAGVTVALGQMKSLGFIAKSQGCIRIVDRDGLESIACECYRFVSDEYRRLLP